MLGTDLALPESTRWRDGRVWVCNWGTGEVLAFDLDGCGAARRLSEISWDDDQLSPVQQPRMSEASS